MRARFLPVIALALLAPVVSAIALHRSGTGLGQPRLAMSISAPGLAAPLPLELRLTYRARRCVPFLTCRADWSGGPAKPIEIERRRVHELVPGPPKELGSLPRTLLSLASFELSSISLRVGRGGVQARIDLLVDPAASGPDAAGRCAIALLLGDGASPVSPSCERISLELRTPSTAAAGQ